MTTDQTTDRRDNTSVILIATITPTLLALVIMTILVHICLCKKINNKQTRLQAEDQQENDYSVVGPPSLPERNVTSTSLKLAIPGTQTTQTETPAHGMNITAITDQEIENISCDQQELNPESDDALLLSSNTAYGTNVAIAPEIDCEVNSAYEQGELNPDISDEMQLSSNLAYGTNVAIAPEIDCHENLAYEQVCHDI